MGAIIRRVSTPFYPDLANRSAVPLYPFFLEGVAADARLNQADGLHPTAEGVDVIVKNILPTVEAFLARYPGNAVEKQAAITLMRCFPGSFAVLELRMLRRVT